MPRPARSLAALFVCAAVAAAGVAAFAVAERGTGKEVPPVARAFGWRGFVGGARPLVSLGQRALVVLSAPSLADRIAAAGGHASEDQQRRWTAAAFAAQSQVLANLAARGAPIAPELRFVRVLNGFSATLDARALALLERSAGIRGVYPVRAVYPAAFSTQPLADPELREGLSRVLPQLAGYDGTGVTIALLDTGVDRATPYLHGHVLDGWDVLAGRAGAGARARPDNGTQREEHGTELAGILVGSGGPAGLRGVVPDATVLPVRVAGWQRDARGRYAVYGRTDQVIAGLERAVDPDGNGDVADGARIALVAVAEPFAAFADSPLSRAVSGATSLDLLVVAAAGNDGPAGPVYGNVSGPGGARDALTVGALDLRRTTRLAPLVVTHGLGVLVRRRAPLLGLVRPGRTRTLRAVPVDASGVGPEGVFDRRGFSRVAGRAAVISVAAPPRALIERLARAGAAAVLVAGGDLPPGALGLDETIGVPVLGAPESLLAAVRRLARDPLPVLVTIGRDRGAGVEAGLAAFSSRGLAFDGTAKPDLVAPGVALPTASPGADAGRSRFVTANGTSVAAAVVAGAAAAVAQARPGLSAPRLRGVLVGTARAVEGAPVLGQGTGLVDPGAAAAAELSANPATLSFGRAIGKGWRAERVVLLRNVTSRPLTVYVRVPERRRPRVAVTVSRGRVVLAAGTSFRLRVRARLVAGTAAAVAAGEIVLAPVGSQRVRVPWAVVLAAPRRTLIGDVRISTTSFHPSETSPAILALRLGRVGADAAGGSIEPVLRLDVELLGADGRRVGLLARLRDLLPGRYAFGITGRDGAGRVLRRGAYSIRISAWPTGGGRPAVRTLRFSIE